MVRKLFAVIVAATLMAGSAWAANMTTVVGGGTATKAASGETGAVSGGIIGIAADVATGHIQGEDKSSGTGAAAIYYVDGNYNLNGAASFPLRITGGSGTGASVTGGAASLLVGMTSAGDAASNAKLTVAGGMNLTAGTSASSGTGGAAYAGILGGAKLIHNAGIINVGAGTFLGFASGSEYTAGSGSITLNGTLLIGASAANATGVVSAAALTSAGVTNLGKIFAATDLGATGVITATLGAGVGLGEDDLILKSGNAAGKMTIAGTAAGEVIIKNNIDLKGSLLDITPQASGPVVMEGAIAANTITTTTGAVTFKNAVTVTTKVDADESIAFVGENAALNGDLDVAGSKTVTIGGATAADAAKIAIGTGKTLTLDSGSIIDIKSGSEFALKDGSKVAITSTPAIHVQAAGTAVIDAGVELSASGNALAATVALIDMKAADSVLSIINEGATDVTASGGTVTVGAAAHANKGIVQIDMNGKTLTGAFDTNGSTLEVVGNTTITGAVTAAVGATDPSHAVGLKVLDNVTATFGTTGPAATTIGSSVELGADSDTTFGGNLAAATGNVTLKDRAVVDYQGTVTAIAMTLGKDSETTAANTVTLTGGDLLSNGGSGTFNGNVTLAATKSMILKDGSDLAFGGAGHLADIVTVEKGASIGATAAGATFNANAPGATTKFEVKSGADLDASDGAITIGNTYTNANVNGNIIVGLNAAGTAANLVTSDAATTNLTNAKILFTPELGTKITAGDTAVGLNTILKGDPVKDVVGLEGLMKVNSMFGQFDLDTDAAGNVFVKAAANQLTGDEAIDRPMIQGNLQTGWASTGAGAEIDYSLANVVYDSIMPTSGAPYLQTTTDEAGNDGLFTLNILQSIGQTGDASVYTQGVGKSVLRNGDASETLNAGVGEIRGINSAIGARNVQLRGQMAGANSVSAEYANPSLSLNNDYANRIWAGYLGQWEKGDSRNGVAGYNYDSNGFIIGYDRLVGCNFAFGGAPTAAATTKTSRPSRTARRSTTTP